MTSYCSSCGKSQHEVAVLLIVPSAHPAGQRLHICDGCVSHCVEALAEAHLADVIRNGT